MVFGVEYVLKNDFLKSVEKVKMLGATPCAIAACMCPIPGDIAKRCCFLLTENLRDVKDRWCELIKVRTV